MTDLLPTEEHQRIRQLVERLVSEEMPLPAQDLLKLQHFVEVVRFEVVEHPHVGPVSATLSDGTTVELSPGQGGRAERVNYYKLNERGLKLLHKWRRGLLDRRVP